MLESILTFLTENKSIIVGAAATIAEVATIVVNFVRKTKANEKVVQTMMNAGDDIEFGGSKPSNGKKLLWSANPINLFKKP